MNCTQMPTLRFNNYFPVDSVDGPLFANKVHFSHPTIDGHPVTVDPSQREACFPPLT
jgi:hypothetical protein